MRRWVRANQISPEPLSVDDHVTHQTRTERRARALISLSFPDLQGSSSIHWFSISTRYDRCKSLKLSKNMLPNRRLPNGNHHHHHHHQRFESAWALIHFTETTLNLFELVHRSPPEVWLACSPSSSCRLHVHPTASCVHSLLRPRPAFVCACVEW